MERGSKVPGQWVCRVLFTAHQCLRGAAVVVSQERAMGLVLSQGLRDDVALGRSNALVAIA
jgi:hypothetical protein